MLPRQTDESSSDCLRSCERDNSTVLCLRGEAIFLSCDERAELRPDLLLSLAPGMPHSVAAQQDTLLLVTISEQIV